MVLSSSMPYGLLHHFALAALACNVLFTGTYVCSKHWVSAPPVTYEGILQEELLESPL